MSKWYSIDGYGNIIEEGGTTAPALIHFNIKTIRKLEKIIVNYIPKHNTCRIEEAKREFKRDKEKAELIGIINEKVDMATPLQIDVKPIWEKQDPNMSVCASCNETIYSTQYLLKIFVNDELIKQERKKVLCEPCYLANVND